MAFLIKVARGIVSVTSHLIQSKPNKVWKDFRQSNIKPMASLRKMMLSLVDHGFKLLLLNACSLKQTFTMIARIKPSKSYLVCSDTKDRYHIRYNGP